jgi:excisionase family DNA binding protein
MVPGERERLTTPFSFWQMEAHALETLRSEWRVAYAVDETLELLSIGRTALYAAIKRGDLNRVKFGKKTLFYAADLAAFLARLRHLSESDESRVHRGSR